jgi:hypothetical protein
LQAAVPCTATAQADKGATCSVITRANALVPGIVTGGTRAIWELGAVALYDGGTDGYAATTSDNQLFARQGLFAP